VRVDVDEVSGCPVDPVGVIDTRQLFPPRQLRVPEAKVSEDALEPAGVRTKDEEIQIVLSAGRPIEGLVALPVAVADPRVVEGAAESRDELERLPRSIHLPQRRAVASCHRPTDARNVTRMHRAIPGWSDIGRVGTRVIEGHRGTRWHPVRFPLTCVLHGLGVLPGGYAGSPPAAPAR
jgi:hypothetical protein